MMLQYRYLQYFLKNIPYSQPWKGQALWPRLYTMLAIAHSLVLGCTPPQMSVQFSSPKPGVGIRDQNRLKGLSGVRDWACHLEAFMGHVQADEQMTKQRRQLSETGKRCFHSSREAETRSCGVQEKSRCRQATWPLSNSYEVPPRFLQLDSVWFLYVLTISSFCLLFTVKYIILMKHSMKSRHTAQNGNTNPAYSLTRSIISIILQQFLA